MYRTILVPLDGDLYSEHALPVAMSLARRSGATVALARVHVRRRFTSEDETREQAHVYLERVMKLLPDDQNVHVTATVLEGEVAETLLNYALEINADLVVMTSHERDVLSDGLEGDIKDQIVRESPLPVLVVHSRETQPDFEQDAPFRHVLIALDASPHDEDIIAPAIDMARLSGAELTLLRVTPGPAAIAAMAPGEVLVASAVSQEVIDDLQSEGKRYLEGLAEPLRTSGLNVRTEAIPDQPGEEILEYTEAKNVDLIAMTTDARSEFARWLLGSQADRVSRHAGVPVLQFLRQGG